GGVPVVPGGVGGAPRRPGAAHVGQRGRAPSDNGGAAPPPLPIWLASLELSGRAAIRTGRAASGWRGDVRPRRRCAGYSRASEHSWRGLHSAGLAGGVRGDAVGAVVVPAAAGRTRAQTRDP